MNEERTHGETRVDRRVRGPPASGCAAARDPASPTIVISAGTCGQASGANDLIRVAKREILDRGLARPDPPADHRLPRLLRDGAVRPGGAAAHLLPQGRAWRTMAADRRGGGAGRGGRGTALPRPGDRRSGSRRQDEIPFFKQPDAHDPRPATRRSIRSGSSTTSRTAATRRWSRCSSAASREWVIDEVKASGLRGRGGAGFPTGLKWELLAKQADGRGKFLVCNADEGDPGAYMDRSVLEGNPHSIIEGMLIGAFATGATEGVIYVRNEYPLAIKHLIIALRQARDLGLLGENILGTGFSLRHRASCRAPGAFVCGEETALIRSIEGKMGEPRQRPPYPDAEGHRRQAHRHQQRRDLGQRPGHHPPRRRRVRRRSASTSNTGTKIFTLVGKIKNTGLVEVPMGITDRRDRLRHRRRPGRQGPDQGGADRRAFGRLHPGRRCSTCPSTTTALPRPARSWAPAA